MAATEIQSLAQVLDRHRREDDRLEATGVLDNAPDRTANARAILGIEAAIQALPIADDLDALIAVGLLSRIVLGPMCDREFETSAARGLICRLIDHLQSTTGKSVFAVARDIADDRIADYLVSAQVKGGPQCH